MTSGSTETDRQPTWVCAAGWVSSGGAEIALGDGDVVTFGRSPDVTLRIAERPIPDANVAGHAGSVHAFGARHVAHNASDHLAFDVCVAGRPPVAVPPGAWFAPPEPDYDIVVAGSFTHTIEVRGAATSATRLAVAPDPSPVELTARQREILEAYAAPLLKGCGPATHQEVARRLNISRSLVRVECRRIFTQLLDAGIPMRNYTDTRDQIADAWARHRI